MFADCLESFIYVYSMYFFCVHITEIDIVLECN
jgi:hypothetical protein